MSSRPPPQDIYARLLSSSRGYPLWTPEPSHELLMQRPEGLAIGDVGVVLEDGGVDVLFNLCLPADHPFHLRHGVPRGFSPINQSQLDIRTIVNAEPPKYVISSSSVTRIKTSASPNDVSKGHDPNAFPYRFDLSSSEGAALALPKGAERFDLLNDELFLEQASQHGAAWYDYAVNRRGRLISPDSLYLITGVHKTRVWSAAVFENASSNDHHTAYLTQIERDNHPPTYGWETTGACTLEWRVVPDIGPHIEHGIPNQAVFIRGFKIAIRCGLLGSRWVSVEADSPSTRSKNIRLSSIVPSSSPILGKLAGFLDVFSPSGSSFFQTTTRSEGTFDADEGRSQSDPNHGGYNGTQIKIQRIPNVYRPFHPSDAINQYLLEKDPSANIAITHDSHWILLLENRSLTQEELGDESSVETALSQNYQVISRDGVVYLEKKSLHPTDGSASEKEPQTAAMPQSSTSALEEDVDPLSLESDVTPSLAHNVADSAQTSHTAIMRPQDIYARLLSSSRGYPLWTPEPSHEFLMQRPEGLAIGDIGVVLEDGSFDVLLNLCSPVDHPFHHRHGVPQGFTCINQSQLDIRTITDAEPPGFSIHSSSVTRVMTSGSPHNVSERHDSNALPYRFDLSFGKGAVLVLPRGAERHDLINEEVFLEQASQHGAAWYDYAVDRRGRLISPDSLYLITGVHKTRVWSAAVFENASSNEHHTAYLTQIERNNQPPTYGWEITGACTSEWRVVSDTGPHIEHGISNQAVFIRGFKISIRSGLLGARWVSVKKDSPSTQNMALSTVVPSSSHFLGRLAGFLNMFSSGGSSIQTTTRSDGRIDVDEERQQNNINREEGDGTQAQILQVPDVPRPFHPSDAINQYLLEQDPFAHLAVTHDTQWMSLVEDNSLTQEGLWDESLVDSPLVFPSQWMAPGMALHPEWMSWQPMVGNSLFTFEEKAAAVTQQRSPKSPQHPDPLYPPSCGGDKGKRTQRRRVPCMPSPDILQHPLAPSSPLLESYQDFWPDPYLVYDTTVYDSGRNTATFWDVATCQAVGRPFQGHTKYVSSVAYSPDAKHIVPSSRVKTKSVNDDPKQREYYCRWTTNGLLCDALVRARDIPGHLASSHAIRGGNEAPTIRCDWDGCGRSINTHSLTRHIQERHLLSTSGLDPARYDRTTKSSTLRVTETTFTPLNFVPHDLSKAIVYDVREIPLRKKLHLASTRQATGAEDVAYSLLEILSMTLPVIYSEGDKAGKLLSQPRMISGDTRTDSCLPTDIIEFSPPPTSQIPTATLYAEMGTITPKLHASLLDPTLAARLYYPVDGSRKLIGDFVAQNEPTKTIIDDLGGGQYCCRWVTDGLQCTNAFASPQQELATHLSTIHGVKGAAGVMLRCRWDNCNAMLRRESIMRHIRIHLGHRRQSSQQAHFDPTVTSVRKRSHQNIYKAMETLSV